MTFPRYQKYHDSSVEWLGEVPEHWSIEKTSRLFVAKKGSDAAKLTKEYCATIEGDYPVYSGQTENQGIMGTINEYEFDAGDKGYLFSTTVGAKAMSVMHLKNKFSLSQNCMVIIPLVDSIIVRFYFYHFQPLFRYERGLIPEHMQASFRVEDLIHFRLASPPVKEQAQIARFLDHEVGKIDALIAEQEKLIALLKEKRQAVISHAVTKGLNPDVPMKESGVEWLGQVPEHWLVKKFGFLANVVRGGSPRPAGDPELFNGDFSPWVTVAEITKDDSIYLNETESFLTQKGSEQCRVFKSGTLVLSNSGATLGVPKILAIDANANDGVVGFEDLKISSVFCYLLLDSMTVDLRERVKQGSGQPNLNTDIVKNIFIAVPPTEEIENIVNFSLKVREQFSKLINEAATFSNLLSERRSALISAAVTGKIDVRGWQPPAA